MSQVKIIPEQIHLLDVRMLRANLEREQDAIMVPIAHSFELRYSEETGFDLENNTAAVKLFIEADALSEDESKLGTGFFELFFYFNIENLKEFVTDVKGENKIDLILAATLVGISFSTARGMIMTFTRNTLYEGLILPVVSPAKLIMEPTTKARKVK